MNSPSGANNYESGAQISPAYSSLASNAANPDYMSAQHSDRNFLERELTKQDLESLKENKYFKRVQSIKEQNEVAEKLDALKLNTMSQTNPDYPLLKFGTDVKSRTARGAQLHSDLKKDDSASVDTQSQISRKSTY